MQIFWFTPARTNINHPANNSRSLLFPLILKLFLTSSKPESRAWRKSAPRAQGSDVPGTRIHQICNEPYHQIHRSSLHGTRNGCKEKGKEIISCCARDTRGMDEKYKKTIPWAGRDEKWASSRVFWYKWNIGALQGIPFRRHATWTAYSGIFLNERFYLVHYSSSIGIQ
jgi:hypothetical protein